MPAQLEQVANYAHTGNLASSTMLLVKMAFKPSFRQGAGSRPKCQCSISAAQPADCGFNQPPCTQLTPSCAVEHAENTGTQWHYPLRAEQPGLYLLENSIGQ